MADELKDSVKETIKKALCERTGRRREIEKHLSDPERAPGSGQYADLAREYGELNFSADLHRRITEADVKHAEARQFLEEFGHEPGMNEFAEQELAAASDLQRRVYEEAAELLCCDVRNRNRNVIVEVRSGAGGQEASLFVSDLLRMYTHYAQKLGWNLTLLDSSRTDLGGFKYITVAIKGKDVWEHLRHESGGHRVQRVPETESQGRIHTSLATVAVLPEAKDVDVELNPDDLEMEYMRSQGPGGQSVNKVNSCVRITHKPTGIAVKCQEEKSQHKNRKLAMELLRTKLYDRQLEEQKREIDSLRRDQIGSGDRNERIRTYNFPQDRVTDHRIGVDIFGVEKVLTGGLDELVELLRKHERELMLEAMSG